MIAIGILTILKQFKDFFNSLVIEPCGDDPLLVIFDPIRLVKKIIKFACLAYSFSARTLG
jgi:hypothetical protein